NQEDEDLAFISVQICAPGSTTNCQTLDHVQVDTGSQGLRVASEIVNSTLMASLQQQTSAGNPVSECVSFGDMSFIWGPVMAGVDIHIGGEVAKNVPIQLTSGAAPPAAAANAGCPATQTGQIVTAKDLGANAILGLGLFRQDCGGGCALSGSGNSGMYIGCSGATCNVIAEPTTAQLQNPVWMFPQDNNGVVLQLPAISASGQQSVQNGLLIFGIGTQSNNAIGSATALQPDVSTGNFGAQFNNVTYNDFNPPNTLGHGSSFIDSGSNGLFFLDSQTLVNSGFPIPDCSSSGGLQGFYCPATAQTINVNLFAENSSTGTIVGSPRAVSFSIQSAQTLFNSGNTAFNDVGGPSPNSFDFGLPFFFGKTIFFGIEGQTTPLGTGPIYGF
ncbi:MAG: DUF3443 family protein, partial [Acidobacteria bacterium]|nr:DUF3443 family protein [Acidobacteriota bacterium]